MKISKVLHVASVISGVLGVLSSLGLFGGGMMFGFSGMMGYGQWPMGSIGFFLIAIWLQIATIHHMMLEKIIRLEMCIGYRSFLRCMSDLRCIHNWNSRTVALLTL